jgi:hypothetical protein
MQGMAWHGRAWRITTDSQSPRIPFHPTQTKHSHRNTPSLLLSTFCQRCVCHPRLIPFEDLDLDLDVAQGSAHNGFSCPIAICHNPISHHTAVSLTPPTESRICSINPNFQYHGTLRMNPEAYNMRCNLECSKIVSPWFLIQYLTLVAPLCTTSRHERAENHEGTNRKYLFLLFGEGDAEGRGSAHEGQKNPADIMLAHPYATWAGKPFPKPSAVSAAPKAPPGL